MVLNGVTVYNFSPSSAERQNPPLLPGRVVGRGRSVGTTMPDLPVGGQLPNTPQTPMNLVGRGRGVPRAQAPSPRLPMTGGGLASPVGGARAPGPMTPPPRQISPFSPGGMVQPRTPSPGPSAMQTLPAALRALKLPVTGDLSSSFRMF
jgi:hypothetical protein